MSEPIFVQGELFNRPLEVEEGTFQRIKSLLILDDTLIPLKRTLVSYIDYIRSIRNWYKLQNDTLPSALLGPMINPNNELGKLYTDLANLAKNFQPGALPGHSDQIRAVTFLSVKLLNELNSTLEHSAFFEAIKNVAAFFTTLADPANSLYSLHDYRQRIDSRLKLVIKAFTDISRIFYEWERPKELKIIFSQIQDEPVTKNDVVEIVDSVKEDVKKVISRNTKQVKSTIIKATQGSAQGCHHRVKAKDKKVQALINYLAKPGVTFSIHDACIKILGSKKSKDFSWLYSWSNNHKSDIQTQVEILHNLQK